MGSKTQRRSPWLVARYVHGEPLEGIKVQINEEEVTDIVADISGPGARPPRAADPARARTDASVLPSPPSESTPFENGVFRIKLVLPSDYPQAPPKGAPPARRSIRRGTARLSRHCRCGVAQATF